MFAEVRKMKKSSGFFIAEGASALLALIFLGLVLTSEPTLTHEERFLWWTLYTYKTLNPTFMFLSILFYVSVALVVIFLILGIVFKYTETKETKPT